MYDTTYTTTLTSADASAAVGGMAALGVGIIIFYFIAMALAYVITSFVLSKIFKKAGIKSSAAWIPIYNTWKLIEMGDQQGFWAILMFVPVANIAAMIFYYIALYQIGKKFGKEDWFIILAILAAPVWFLILAFGKDQWNGGTAPIAAAAPAAPVTPPTDTTTPQM